MLEASIEKYLKESVERRGGRCFKLSTPGSTGIPDRLVVMPGRLAFVELKRPKGGIVSAKQRWFHGLLRAAGAEVALVHTIDGVDELMRRVP